MQPTKDFDRYKWMKEPIIKPKKLTFEEWFEKNYSDYTHSKVKWFGEIAWKAAQQNV